MKKHVVILMPLIVFFCTGCLIKQPKEETIFNITVNKEDANALESTENASIAEDISDGNEEVVTEKYSEETLEFDRLIKEIGEQTKEQ